jgi:hypothetical protein
MTQGVSVGFIGKGLSGEFLGVCPGTLGLEEQKLQT